VDLGAFEFQTLTTTAVTSSASPSTYGESVTSTATVTALSTPTGSVNFVIDSGTPVAGTVKSTTSTTATWTFTTSPLSAGNHTVQAFYLGTGYFANSNGTLSGGQTVKPAAITITASAQKSKTFGQTLSFGTGSTKFTSSGLENNETIGSVTLAVSGNGGAATAAVGGYTITPSAATGGTFKASNYTITYDTDTLTVKPAALASTANLAANAAQITINGFGFDPTAANNKVTFNDGAAGTVTTATSTSLTDLAHRDVLDQAQDRWQRDGGGDHRQRQRHGKQR
jgi:trimeric autotransporter adhesin